MFTYNNALGTENGFVWSYEKPDVMKVLLRSRETGLFYGGTGCWVHSPGEAATFQGVREAVRTYWTEGLRDAELVFQDKAEPQWEEFADCI